MKNNVHLHKNRTCPQCGPKQPLYIEGNVIACHKCGYNNPYDAKKEEAKSSYAKNTDGITD